MTFHCFADKVTGNQTPVPICFVEINKFLDWLNEQTSFIQNWMRSQNAGQPKVETFYLLPDTQGNLSQVIAIPRSASDKSFAGTLAMALPVGTYQLSVWEESAALAWGMGAYQFTRYKAPRRLPATLLLPAEIDHSALLSQLHAIYFVRDLINTPTEEMGPAQLAEAAQKIAHQFSAEFTQIIGEDLLLQQYPAIHAVGRASAQAPRLLDIRWGDARAPKITLVGKGVCFDSGGLDIKTASSMAQMKKDMGGAANVLGLALMIMQAQLPVRLRVLIPAVENAISGNAYRPGDVIKTRKQLTVEIGNTDAEGRVILADALTEAVSENPALLIDMATLTGAAKVALGADLPGFFTSDEKLAQALLSHADAVNDPIWRLPLYTPYRKLLDSPIADINNATNTPWGGAITAALFLKEFVGDFIPWVHFDIMAWNNATTPAHPEGAEAVAIRALFSYLCERFSA